jgi:hypothetical protein
MAAVFAVLIMVAAAIAGLIFALARRVNHQRMVTSPARVSYSSKPGEAGAILRELAATEQAYVSDLRRLIGCKETFPELSLGGIEALLLLHTELVNTLGAHPAPSAAASAFERLGPFLKVYVEYVVGQLARLAALGDLRSKSAGRRRLAAVQVTHGQTLDSLMIKPVQRLCKYPLLLASLVKALRPSEERKQLSAALVIVERQASEVNRRSREAEEAAKVLELGDAWRGLVCPTRVLRHCMHGIEVQARLGGAPSAPLLTNCSLYLFTDLVVVAESVRHSTVSAFLKRTFGGMAGSHASSHGERSVVRPREHVPLSGLQLIQPTDKPKTLLLRRTATRRAGSNPPSTATTPTSSAGAHVDWLELLFATVDAAAAFATRLREAASAHRTLEESANQRAETASKIKARGSIVRRDATVSDADRTAH